MRIKFVFKKTGLNLIILLSLSLTNQTYPMFSGMKNYCSSLIWGDPEESHAKKCIEVVKICVNNNTAPDPKDLFDVSQNSKISAKNKSLLQVAKDIRFSEYLKECVERIKNCVINKTMPDPKDVFDVHQDSKVSEQNKDLLLQAEGIIVSNSESLVEQEKKDDFKCSFCSFPFELSSPHICCNFCLKSFYCDLNCQCQKDDCMDHKKDCLKNILEEKYAKEGLERIKICLDNGVGSYPKDLFDVFQDTKILEQNRDLIQKAVSVRNLNNKDVIVQAKKNCFKCSCCNSTLKSESFKAHCNICLKSFYCDSSCRDKHYKKHKENCLKAILEENEKHNKECIARVKICVDSNNQSDQKDIFDFLFQDLKKTGQDAALLGKAEVINFLNNKDKVDQLLKNDVKCCSCNSFLKPMTHFKVCGICLKAFYCLNEKKCYGKEGNDHKKYCLKAILEEKTKNLLQNQNKNNPNVETGDRRFEEIDLEEASKKEEVVDKIEIEKDEKKEDILKTCAGKKEILREHVVDFKAINNIEYFWLNTVNHFDKKVISGVAAEFLRMRKDYMVRKMCSLKDEEPISFYPEGTCGAQSMRNVDLISKFLKSKDNNQKKQLLKDMSDAINAKDYLQAVIDANLTTSFLDARDIESRVCNLDLGDEITVLDSVLEVETTKKEEIAEIIEKFKAPNYHHIFIVNTADLAHLGVIDKHRREFQRINHCKIDEESFNAFKKANNWYVIAIEKCENSLTCLIVDTEPLIGKMEKSIKYEISNCLCEYILVNNDFSDGDRSIDRFKKIIMEQAPVTFLSAIKNGQLKNDSQYDDRLLTHQENEELSKSLEKSIYNSAPIEVKAIIDSYENAAMLAEKDSNVKTKNDHFKRLPHVLILYGPNGTGKSDIARVFAQKTKRKLFFINCGLLGTKFQYSESENLKDEIYPVIELCKLGEKCVVVLDETDALVVKNQSENRNSNSVEAAIGNLLDTCKKYDIVFICPTNHVDVLPAKLLDRAKLKIEVKLPDLKSRRGILEYLLIKCAKDSKRVERANLQYKSLNLDLMAKMTDGFSIRVLELLIEGVYDIAIKRISNHEVILIHQDFLTKYNEIKNSMANFESIKGKPIVYEKSSSWTAIKNSILIPVVIDIAREAAKVILPKSPKVIYEGTRLLFAFTKYFWLCFNDFKYDSKNEKFTSNTDEAEAYFRNNLVAGRIHHRWVKSYEDAKDRVKKYFSLIRINNNND